MFLRCKDNIFF